MAERRTLTERFRDNLRALGLAEADARVLVAVSGGVDSVLLLHLFRFAAADLGISVFAAHFDHAMRPGSDRDAHWVAGLCRAWGIPLLSGRTDRVLRSEDDARRARYAFLAQVRDELRATWLATAHHADDQAETVLFRVLRGTGITGLAGIPPVDERRRIVRPLLPFWRAEIVRAARARRLRWREDPTNAGTDAVRNRIRHEILPLLERRVSPAARRNLVSLAALAREDERAWSAVLDAEIAAAAREEEGALVLVRERFAGYDSALGARVLREVLRRFGAVPDRDGTRSALRFIGSAPSGRTLELAGGVRIRTEFGAARVERAAAPQSPDAPLAIEGERGEGAARIGGRELRVTWAATEPDRAASDEGCRATFRAGALRFPLLLRGRLPGDRVRTPAGTKTLKKLFVEHRVPRSARARVPVLADAEGRVLWVAGVAVGAPAPRPGERGFTIGIADA